MTLDLSSAMMSCCLQTRGGRLTGESQSPHWWLAA